MTASSPDLKTIFGKAVAIPLIEERARFLDQACGGNAALRTEVDELLKALDGAGSFMTAPEQDFEATLDHDPGVLESEAIPSTRSQTPPRSIAEGPGTVIGHYKLLQQIGEGGFGVVFMAEQHEPVRRKVALKVIKPGMDSKEVVARFEAERQALALMDHPNIAHIFDGGTTDSGRPYIVMELVKGVPITDYCDKNNLSLPRRLELFVTVCHALQHAHQKGIIHRDIKPNNIMVTLHDGKPVPKVIDFGVAKAISQRLTEKTLFTAYGQVIGTPAYMSPEQAEMSGLDIDTRSDIYALGVLLYELLTGKPPFDAEQLRRAGFAEMLRIICEQQPPRPSTRFSTMGDELTVISNHRSVEPKKLGQLVRGDLDWIVMRALEKERSRRYETPNAFAADIERFLKNEPVEACPPSAVYRFRKLFQRNKTVFAAAVTILVVLLTTTSVSTWQAVRAIRAENAAEAAAENEKAQRQTAERERVRADQERVRSQQAHEQAQDALGRSFYDQAVALRSSDKLGRRWRVLELLQEAEKLRTRSRNVSLPQETTLNEDTVISAKMASRAQLRSEALAALRLQDARDVGVPVAFAAGSHVSLTADGRFAAGVFSDERVPESAELRLVDLASGSQLARWKSPEMSVSMLSPDGKLLVSIPKSTVDDSKGNRPLSLWQIPEGKWVPEGKRVRALDWPQDSEGTRPGHHACAPVFSPDGKHLAALMSIDGQLKFVFWDVKSGKVTSLAHEKIWNRPSERWISFSSNGKVVAYPAGEKTIAMVDLESNERTLHEFPLEIIGQVAFSPNDRLLAVACGMAGEPFQRTVLLWDMTNDMEQARFSVDSTPVPLTTPLAFSPDGKRLAVGHSPGDITVFDAFSGKKTLRLPSAHTFRVHQLFWKPDGRQLISGGALGLIKQWELSDDALVTSVETGSKGLSSKFVFSPDGKWLAVGFNMENETRLINRASGLVQRTFAKSGDMIFRPNSRQLAVSVAIPPEVIVWDVHSGKEVTQWKPKLGRTFWRSVTYWADGRLLTLRKYENRLEAWDATKPGDLDNHCGHESKVRLFQP